MSLVTTPSLECYNLVYAMLIYFSIKVQNQTGDTRRGGTHQIGKHFPRNNQKNQLRQEIRNLDIFKVFIMNQSTKYEYS